jgi:hypothetical protein
MPASSGNGRQIWLACSPCERGHLIGAEVFGAAFARLGLRQPVRSRRIRVHILQALFFILGVGVMISFIRNAQKVNRSPPE